jgi:phosphatidylglycerophosphate synthase
MGKSKHQSTVVGFKGKSTTRGNGVTDPDKTGEIASIILPAPEAPEVFGQAPALHLRKMLTASGVSTILSPSEAQLVEADTVMIWNGAAACSKAMLQNMLKRGNFLLEDEQGRPLAARVTTAHYDAALAWMLGDGAPPRNLSVSSVGDFGTIYNRALRKSEAPFCTMVTPENLRAVEKRIYLSTYKGVTDFVTKYVWPAPALFLTRLFLRAGLSPNAVTFASVGFMFAAMYLFWDASYGLGLLAAWIMALLDTVDGKMARVSHTSSAFGNILDHGMDLVHPPFWYLAWAIGLAKTGTPLPAGWFEPLVGSIFAVYIVTRLFEGYFIRRFGFHIHVWRRFDSFFRLIVARRNANLVLLMAMWAVGRPDLGVILVAAWQIIALAVHVVQSLQAVILVRKHRLRSWLELEAENAVSN